MNPRGRQSSTSALRRTWKAMAVYITVYEQKIGQVGEGAI